MIGIPKSMMWDAEQPLGPAAKVEARKPCPVCKGNWGDMTPQQRMDESIRKAAQAIADSVDKAAQEALTKEAREKALEQRMDQPLINKCSEKHKDSMIFRTLINSSLKIINEEYTEQLYPGYVKTYDAMLKGWQNKPITDLKIGDRYTPEKDET